MELGSVIGLPLGIGLVLIGMILEGGHIGSIMGFAAFVIVIGGAFGAALLQTPFDSFIYSVKNIAYPFKGANHNYDALVEQVVKLATIARKDGLLALEKERENIEDEMLADALRFAIDGLEPNLVQSILEARIDYKMERYGEIGKFFMDFGTYCPTVGILGAVLGLIHVMENLDNPAAIGPGIAVAFIATVYGVGFSNLIFLPLGNKVKNLVGHEHHYYEMIKIGVKDIQLGTSPTIIASHLLSVVNQQPKDDGEGGV